MPFWASHEPYREICLLCLPRELGTLFFVANLVQQIRCLALDAEMLGRPKKQAEKDMSAGHFRFFMISEFSVFFFEKNIDQAPRTWDRGDLKVNCWGL